MPRKQILGNYDGQGRLGKAGADGFLLARGKSDHANLNKVAELARAMGISVCRILT